MTKPYTTFIMGKDNYEIAPFAESIRATEIEHTGMGYEITYRIPAAMVPHFMAELTDEEKINFKFRLVAKSTR